MTPAEIHAATASPSADQSANAPRRLETKPCSRCGGSGKMPFSVYGGVCFKCNGSGKLYTPRGRAARAFLDRLRQRTVEQLTEGMLVFYQGFSCGGINVPSKFYRLISVGPVKEAGRSKVGNGDWVTHYGRDLVCEGMTFGAGADDQTLYRVGHTAQGKALTLRLALDYQDSLTKSGKVKAGVSWASPEAWVKDAVKQGDPLLVRETPKTTEVK